MNRFCLLSLLAVVLICPGVLSAERPNIIYIMTDDLGYGDLGCFGQEQIKTPNIDRLREQGMKLTSYYAGCTVCRPSRLVLWTGRHTGHTPISSNAQYVFQPEDTTVAELLQQAGYATGGVGKWAMGPEGSGGEPIHHGFDFWCGYLDQGEAHNYYPTHLFRCQGDLVKRVPLEGNVLMDDPAAKGRVAKPDCRVTYSHDVMTEDALSFIRRNRKGPFLLHVHWTIPHANNEGGRVLGDGMEVPDYGPYAERDWPNTEKGHAAMISRMDADVGRMLSLLGELSIDRRTLIIFTSDNGPHSEGGHKHEYFNSNGPLRGFKRDLYEGGIRVPTIAWQPGFVPAGSESDEPLAFYDFLATACELAGVDTPTETDGVSFVPTLCGQSDRQKSHDYLYWRYGKKEAVRKGNWKAVRLDPDKPIELYDLAADIGEASDVASENVEIVGQMKAIMQQMAE